MGREKRAVGIPNGPRTSPPLSARDGDARVPLFKDSILSRASSYFFEFFLPLLHQNLSVFSIFEYFVFMASSSGNPHSLVVLRFHDFRAERMRHWWTLLGGDDHASIKGVFSKFSSLMRLWVDRGLLEALASFWDLTYCCFSIGEMDLVPTLEEYAKLLQLDSLFSESPIIPTPSSRSNQVLEKYLGLASKVLRPEICRVDETWQKASISLDLLTKYFSWGDFPAELAGDFIAGEQDWKKFRVNAFKIAFAGIFLFPTSAGRIDLEVIPLIFSEGRSIIPAILYETVRSLSYCQR